MAMAKIRWRRIISKAAAAWRHRRRKGGRENRRNRKSARLAYRGGSRSMRANQPGVASAWHRRQHRKAIKL